MKIRRIQIIEHRAGIPFPDLDTVKSALQVLGAWRGEDPDEVDALAGRLAVVVTDGTHEASELGRALKHAELRSAGVSTMTEAAQAFCGTSAQRRTTFVHNTVWPRPPFVGLSIRAEPVNGAYVLHLGDSGAAEAELATAFGVVRTLTAVTVDCEVQPTGRHGERFELDFDEIMRGPRRVGLTTQTGDAVSRVLYGRAARIAAAPTWCAPPSWEMESSGLKATLHLRGCDVTGRDDDRSLLGEWSGATVAGPRTTSVLDETELAELGFSITVTGTVTADELLAFARDLAEKYE